VYFVGTYTEKAHLLETVIDNIKRDGSYYQEATLPFVVKDVDPLYKKLVDYGYQF
jgi:isochorismate hydrolase